LTVLFGHQQTYKNLRGNTAAKYKFYRSKITYLKKSPKQNYLAVAARGEIGREGCEISSLVEHMELQPWLFL